MSALVIPGPGVSDVKDSVRLMTAAKLPNDPVAAGAGFGKTITAGSNSTLTVDGSTAALGDRIGVKNEADSGGLGAAHNGIYVVTVAGSGSVKWVLTRATDFDSWVELPGAIVNVEIGTANAGTQWVCNVAAGGTIETTAITFTVPVNYLAKSALGTGVEAALGVNVGDAGAFVTNDAPYSIGAMTGTVTLDLDDGAVQYGHVTGNTTIAVPTGTPTEAKSEITCLIQYSGGQTLDFAAGIKRASDSAAIFPKTLTTDLSYIFKLKYMGGFWCLVSLVGGFEQDIN